MEFLWWMLMAFIFGNIWIPERIRKMQERKEVAPRVYSYVDGRYDLSSR